ncbi:MAG: hypothetical protein SNF33_04630 [Candidatus Algichlamydia australiensis]|nr:hypothetical protein [Chlamydiales bacterium]
MDGPVPPIPPPDRSEQEKVRLSSSQEQRAIRKRYFHSREERDRKPSVPFAWVTGLIKKVFHILTSEKEGNLLKKDTEAIRDDLRKLKKYLSQLEERDESENPLFIERLSSIWEELYQLTETGALIEPKLLETVGNLQTLFESYPPGELHSFHFYLVKHAGMSWFPFPFIEMLKNLHKEAQQNPKNAHLTQWIAAIDISIS